MRKRNNHRDNHFLKNWLHWLKKLWKSLINFFTKDLSGFNSRRSPKSQQLSSSRRSQRYEELNDQLHQDGEPAILNSRPAPFLLGLENIDNLEFLTTKELIEQIEWNAESQEILTAKEEDLTLLEDLLVNFPET
ncbi:hypothetical protein APA_3470 [Pseudanabaena sp. lw0831]|uniref:hypothetical protein n=1 Tax=Pseudanabaena sp. lw0831 TaxID=1357935 RepID=UPI001915BD7F|nr:hypothetical protein [Pseudanabaena sp. lw0831]GBO51889.1 hypothetical protein APA_3470 [Pseudanabaena sp. lw0831]